MSSPKLIKSRTLPSSQTNPRTIPEVSHDIKPGTPNVVKPSASALAGKVQA
jgi:hypothetical protein